MTTEDHVTLAVGYFSQLELDLALKHCNLALDADFCCVGKDILLLTSMIYYLKGDVGMALNVATTCRDLYREENLDNMFVTFLLALGANILLRKFRDKVDKILPMFDTEIIYTTEDEVFVPRKVLVAPPFSRQESDFFWKCVVSDSPSLRRQWGKEYRKFEKEIERKYKHASTVLAIDKIISKKITQGERVLELGSGIGKFGYLLYEKGIKENVTFLDINGDLLDYSRECFDEYCTGHNYNFVVGDAKNLSCLSALGIFDVVVACDIVEHLYNTEFIQVLDNVLSILKKGGRFYIQTPDGLRYLGEVADEKGEIAREEFLGDYLPHVSEKSVGFFKMLLSNYDCKYKILYRGRIILEITKEEYK